ncbi:MAG: thioredoxin family protein [Pseudomonadota bacterium]
MQLKSAIFALLVILATSCFSFARAQLFQPVEAVTVGSKLTATTEHAVTTLAPTQKGFVPGETIWFVFRQQLEDGWHVYWRNPGDSGLPLELKWDLPTGFRAGETVNPPPERIPVGDFVNFGHHGAPVFLSPVHVPAAATVGDTVTAKLLATWLICEQVCVPETATFDVSLPITQYPGLDHEEMVLAEMAQSAAPKPHSASAVIYENRANRNVLVVDALGTLDKAAETHNPTAFFFPYKEGVFSPSSPQSAGFISDKVVLSIKRLDDAEPLQPGQPVGGVVQIDDGKRSRYVAITAEVSDALAPSGLVEMAAPPDFGTAAETSRTQTVQGFSAGNGFLFLAMAAFFGGMLLNIMPCVFPILFIKAAHFVELENGAQNSINITTARRHAAFYVLGVVVMFLTLGGALLLLRAGGAAIGWGFHLQNPIAVALSVYVLLLIGLNLFGVFEVGTSAQNIGSSLAKKTGLAGSFFTGVLTVFVAAPCIGPLLSAPMGAAVFLPPSLGLLIFTLIALGLAAPYAIITTTPAVARRLPKPGKWMGIFKQGLAFPVLGAAAYFVWVLAEQTGTAGLGRTLLGLLTASIAAWLFGLSQNGGTQKMLLSSLALVAFGLSLASIAGLRIHHGAQTVNGYGRIESSPWSEAAIEAERAKGRGVFVDFTAAWCVTCQFNKVTILSRPSLADRFRQNNVSLFAADWTRRDPQISAALEGFGASGVPFYVYFPPKGAPEVLGLPLTEQSIVKAIEARPGIREP